MGIFRWSFSYIYKVEIKSNPPIRKEVQEILYSLQTIFCTSWMHIFGSGGGPPKAHTKTMKITFSCYTKIMKGGSLETLQAINA